MPVTTVRWAIRGLVLLSVPVLVVAQEPQPRTIPERVIPVPDTVSPGLKKIIASPSPRARRFHRTTKCAVS